LAYSAGIQVRLTAKQLLSLLVAVLLSVSTFALEKPTKSKEKHEILRGRVVADVVSTGFGAGLGPKWVTFVFMARGVGGRDAPVKIAYAFYKTDQLPPPSFWDYEVLYELEVERDQKCDTTVQAISYEKATDENGQTLPPRKVLQPAKSAPTDLLKPETPLPCYVLWYGQYKRIGSTDPH
jgi:hypothetical protein